MTDYHDDVRTEGPVVVRAGPAGGTTVLVFDPAGLGKHGELPPTWEPITETRRVVWCRLPAAGFDPNEVNTLFEEHHEAGVHVLTSGSAVEDVLSLARSSGSTVRSVFLVDPEPGALSGPVAAAQNEGIDVRVIAEERDPAEDIGAEPLPLGHPAVVRELTQYLG
jgi:hypothetical protein